MLVIKKLVDKLFDDKLHEGFWNTGLNQDKSWCRPRFMFLLARSFALAKQEAMPTYQTQVLIDDLQQQTEAFINKAVTHWQMMPHKQFAYKQSPEKWSANQCLQHLNSYGHYYLPAIEKAIASGKSKQTKPTFKSGWLGNYFTNLMQPKQDGSLSKKIKSPKNQQPTNNADSHLVIAAFIEQQEQLLLLLERARDIDMNKIKVPISISPFIKLKLGDVFMFLIAHNQRHVLQAEKALTVNLQ
jgi:hypothetical protein